MHTRARTSLTVLLVVLTAILVSTTTATALRSISIAGGTGTGNEANIQTSGALKFSEENGRGGLNIEREFTCNVTILRTISRIIPKVVGILIGRVTGVRIDVTNCTHGAAISSINDIRALSEMTGLVESCTPREAGGVKLCVVTGGAAELWRLFFVGFTGTLPTITGMLFNIEKVQFKLIIVDSVFRVRNECAYEGRVAARADVEARGAITGGSILLPETSLTARRLAGVLCPSPSKMSGSFTVVNGPKAVLI